MNRVLEQLGYLRLGRGSALVGLLAWGRLRSIARVAYDKLGLHGRVAVPTQPVDWARTVAYTSVVSTGEGVSIALRGREPDGRVAPEDYERVRDEVAASLLAFTDPETGDASDQRRAAEGGGARRARTSTAPPTCCSRPPRSTR